MRLEFPPLHVRPPDIDPSLLLVLFVAGVIAAVLLGLALIAYTRRKSRPYFLVALAIGALFGRTIVAALAILNRLAPTTRHLVEHVLDIAMVALVIGAVYHARTVDLKVERGEQAD